LKIGEITGYPNFQLVNEIYNIPIIHNANPKRIRVIGKMASRETIIKNN